MSREYVGRDGKRARCAKWSAMVNFQGREMMQKTGVEICADCARASLMPGRSREERDVRQAVYDRCRQKLGCRALARQRMDAMLLKLTQAFFAGDANTVPVKVARVPTIAEVIACYREHWAQVINNRTVAWRNTTSLLLVVAYAEDLWKIKTPGVGPTGIKIGERYADEEKIGALPITELTAEMAKAYFVNRCQSLDLPCSWATSAARAEYVTLNSTMKQTRDLFRVKALEHVYKGRVTLPALTAWMEYPLLPEADVEPEPLTVAQFAAMVAAAENLRESDPDLWLCNRVLRQTGLRVGSIAEMRADWVEKGARGYRLLVKSRKSGTSLYSVPLLPETAEAILARPGLTFGDDAVARERLVNTRHNAFLKGIIGDPQRGQQGAHRLRDTLAGGLYDLLGKEAAQRSLGHASDKTTLEHYARVPLMASDLMRAEFGAF